MEIISRLASTKANAIEPIFKKRPSQKRGRADLGWLDSRHSFSFGSYLDPVNMGFRCLRVINEDTVALGKAYGIHAHDNMQILTYVVSGTLEQKDSTGDRSVVRAGDIQCITAGTGVTHNELNPSRFEPLHLYQFWFYPNQQNLKPNRQQRSVEVDPGHPTLHLIGSNDGRDDTLRLEQDLGVWVGRFAENQTVRFPLAAGRHAWLQVVTGDLQVSDSKPGVTLTTGDGLAISDATGVQLNATRPSEIIVFDLA